MARAGGFLIVELVVALSLIILLASLTAFGIASYRKAQANYAWRQAAAWAADAQMQRYLAGAPLDTPAAAHTPPAVKLETDVQPGAGAWTGCDLVTVTARVELRRERAIIQRVACYLPRKEQP